MLYLYLKSGNVAHSLQAGSGSLDQRSLPDGRQTRIDFFRSARQPKSDPHIVTPRKASFEWWHALTGWLKSSKHEREHNLDEYGKFLEERKYSLKTRNSYLFMLRKFFDYLDKKEVREISFGDIEDYNYDFFVKGRYSRSYQLQFINALTLYLEFAQGVRVNLKGLRRPVSKR